VDTLLTPAGDATLFTSVVESTHTRYATRTCRAHGSRRVRFQPNRTRASWSGTRIEPRRLHARQASG
jgi:hypothetical protein